MPGQLTSRVCRHAFDVQNGSDLLRDQFAIGVGDAGRSSIEMRTNRWFPPPLSSTRPLHWLDLQPSFYRVRGPGSRIAGEQPGACSNEALLQRPTPAECPPYFSLTFSIPWLSRRFTVQFAPSRNSGDPVNLGPEGVREMSECFHDLRVVERFSLDASDDG